MKETVLETIKVHRQLVESSSKLCGERRALVESNSLVEITPLGGQPITVQAEIKDNTRENEAAKEVARKKKAELA